MIKFIVCDMDGTLLDEEGHLNHEFFSIFKELEKKDIRFAVASGRQYYQLYKQFEPISDNIVYIAENGTLVVYKGEEIYSSVIDKSIAISLVEDALKIEDIYIVLCGKEAAYINTTDEFFLEEAMKYYFNYRIVDNFDDVKDDILNISIYDQKGLEGNSRKILYEKWKNELQIVASTPKWLDIYNIGVNKGKAVDMIQKKYNIGKDDTMIFGDYFNDIEMLKEGYHSYAMENAPQEIKDVANFVAKSNKDNGVLRIIKEKVLK
ncbi:HAD family hydrolase [Tissierella sp. Yu-01]|uniref:Cof-type HAD-IIB family hydrolase n=1 Tax=Tissierella sp. Yu-01 TaxID=3035694 RepID=UPI00240D43D9|nr:HAD family hydrolase [Tissierella sp. Yu-01]WFA09241.1 HAD family hydrolase [Tissierella sp. Yu-01]